MIFEFRLWGGPSYCLSTDWFPDAANFAKLHIHHTFAQANLVVPIGLLNDYCDWVAWSFALDPACRDTLPHEWTTGAQNDFVVFDGGGETKNGVWIMKDSGYEIQRLIDWVDGHVYVIFFMVCNHDGSEITSKKSIVVHPADVIMPDSLGIGISSPKPLRIFIPGKGYADQ
ncbi:MAG: hypothetical protein AAB783_00280 [Patescibacteria group bacterium]